MLRRNEHDLIGFLCQVVAAPMCSVHAPEGVLKQLLCNGAHEWVFFNVLHRPSELCLNLPQSLQGAVQCFQF